MGEGEQHAVSTRPQCLIVDAAGSDVTAAVKGWLVDTSRMHPEAVIVYLGPPNSTTAGTCVT